MPVISAALCSHSSPSTRPAVVDRGYYVLSLFLSHGNCQWPLEAFPFHRFREGHAGAGPPLPLDIPAGHLWAEISVLGPLALGHSATDSRAGLLLRTQSQLSLLPPNLGHGVVTSPKACQLQEQGSPAARKQVRGNPRSCPRGWTWARARFGVHCGEQYLCASWGPVEQGRQSQGRADQE